MAGCYGFRDSISFREHVELEGVPFDSRSERFLTIEAHPGEVKRYRVTRCAAEISDLLIRSRGRFRRNVARESAHNLRQWRAHTTKNCSDQSPFFGAQPRARTAGTFTLCARSAQYFNYRCGQASGKTEHRRWEHSITCHRRSVVQIP
jgi:hypothetical protein